MAASESKPSPSNQSIENDTKGTASDVPEKSAPPATVMPSYESSEESDHYVSAKALLQQGAFEDALTVIEQAIETTKASLLSFGVSSEEIDRHPSLAPFHYMYGTTLLYSVEEGNSEQGMTTVEEGAAAADGSDDSSPEENVDDLEIAWENLETARAIIEGMLAKQPNEKLELDLAQVYLRIADEEKLNGRYADSARDYAECLKHLEASNIGKFDRKVADAHYNLSLVTMLHLAEERSSENPSQDLLQELRRKGFHHSFQCGRTLCGQIAFLCDQDAEEFLAQAEGVVANLKSTGEDEETELPAIASAKLKALKERVRSLTPREDAVDQVQELCELLTEIQETIDEAERSEEGVQEITAMKAEITAAAAAASAPEEEGFGSAAAATVTAVAQPVMAVRKKKKRDADDAKMPANEAASKRPTCEGGKAPAAE